MRAVTLRVGPTAQGTSAPTCHQPSTACSPTRAAKLTSVALLKYNGHDRDPFMLGKADDLSTFGYFQRGAWGRPEGNGSRSAGCSSANDKERAGSIRGACFLAADAAPAAANHRHSQGDVDVCGTHGRHAHAGVLPAATPAGCAGHRAFGPGGVRGMLAERQHRCLCMRCVGWPAADGAA